ncbi:MAG: hypothetical protein WCT04_18485 [Planctomycetota bacterium]
MVLKTYFNRIGFTTRGFVLSFVALAGVFAFGAELPDPVLTVISPQGGKAGETTHVAIIGTDIAEATLRFTHPGIVATVDPKDAKKFKVAIAKDVPSGHYDVRIAGKFGVSNPRIFEVSTVTEIVCDGKNLGRDTALETALPCVVNGAALSQRTLWFKIALQKGHTLTVDCRASHLDSKMVPVAAIIDANGHERIRARDAVITWKADTDGPFFLSLRDFLSNGSAEHFFRLYLHEGDDPKPAISDAPFVFWPPSKDAIPEAHPDDQAHPMALTPPCEISGQFFPVGDSDTFKFDAKKGDVWWLEVISQRLGLPTNPRLVIQRLTRDTAGIEAATDVLELNDSPPIPGSPDFEGSNLDPVGRFESKEDGTYRIALRDLNNTLADDASRRYTLSIRRESPDFTLIAIPATSTENTPGAKNNGPVITVHGSNIRPDEVMPIRVLVLRRDGFKGDVSLSAEDLPEGITTLPTIISGDSQDTHLFMKAAPTAKAWAGAIRIIGKAMIEGKEAVRTARASTPVWPSKVSDFIEPARSRFATDFTLGVVTDVPFPSTVTSDGKPLEAPVGGKVKFSFQVTRNPEFKDTLKMKPAGVPGLDKAKDMEVTSVAKTSDYELDLAPLKLAAGTYTFWFKGQDKGKLPLKTKPDDKAKPDDKPKLDDVTVTVYSSPVIVNLVEAKKESKPEPKKDPKK